MPAAEASCFIALSLLLNATASDAPLCATFEHTCDTKISASEPPVAIADSPIGVSAWGMPVITINGKNAAKIPTITHPSFADRKLITAASPSPAIFPSGPITISAIGAAIRITNVGCIIIFNILGVIASTIFSM